MKIGGVFVCLFDWLIDFDSVSTSLGLFYAYGVRESRLCIFKFAFLCSCSYGFFLHTVPLNANNFCIDLFNP